MPGPARTWRGACHCRRTRFTVTAEIDHVRVCNCSVCRARGALIFRVPEGQLRLETPLDDLAVYAWGTGTARDYFCKTCGILPFRRPRQPTDEERAAGKAPFAGWAVNARCLEGFDPDSIPVRRIEGASLPLP